MDDKQQGSEPEVERSEEEIAWDEEFRDELPQKSDDVATTLADLARLAVQIPAVLITMPANLLPQDTRRHARAAVREGFLAVRSLLGAIGDGIEGMLAEPAEGAEARAGVRSGPAGTWGTAPSEGQPFSSGSTRNTPASGKVRRIEVSEDESATSTEAGEEGESREGRGLRADIDY